MLGFRQGRGLRQVVDDERRLRVAVVHRRQGREPFLAGRVPDLELDRSCGEIAFLGEEGGFRVGSWLVLRLVPFA